MRLWWRVPGIIINLGRYRLCLSIFLLKLLPADEVLMVRISAAAAPALSAIHTSFLWWFLSVVVIVGVVGVIRASVN